MLNRGLRKPFALLIGVLALLAWAAPVLAHTSLVSSNPYDGEVLERAPKRLSMHFAAPVDPRTLQLDLLKADGQRVRDLASEDHRRSATVDVDVELPDLAPGPYVVHWVSVGKDGHRATGEVVFGVGAVALADLRSAGGGGFDPITLAGGLARWGVALGLALGVGATLALRWARAREADPVLRWWAPIVARVARPALDAGILVAAGLLLVRTVLFAWLRVAVESGPLTDRLWAALAPPAAYSAVVSIGVLAVVLWLRRRNRADGWSHMTDATAAGSAAALVVASAALGHAGASDAGPHILLIAGIHGLAASVWIGPLLVAGLFRRTSEWRSASPETRSSVARAAGRSLAPVAAGAFAALLATGPILALIDGSWSELSGTFKWVLIAKAVLVIAVVAPLGALHDANVGWLASRRRRRGDGRSDSRLGRTLVAESLVLTLVLGGGAILASVNPKSAPPGQNLLAPVNDPAACLNLQAGRFSCYRRYLASILDHKGPKAAAAELDRLSREVPDVTSQCHQLAHDLGNDAVAVLGGIAKALAQAPPSCASGYYHGVVEIAVSNMGQNPDGKALSGTCTALARKGRYALPHYNCVHGLGHGVMLLTDHKLSPALDLCERIQDEWEKSSCLGGVFMERIISIQASPERDDSNGDLLYPCSKVRESELDECFFLQSSYFLWKLGGDKYAEAFALCDKAPAVGIDNCYRSMGRDIGNIVRHDPTKVKDACGSGSPTYFASCVEAAALDAAYQAQNPKAAEPVCALLPSPAAENCVRGAQVFRV